MEGYRINCPDQSLQHTGWSSPLVGHGHTVRKHIIDPRRKYSVVEISIRDRQTNRSAYRERIEAQKHEYKMGSLVSCVFNVALFKRSACFRLSHNL